MAKRIVRVWVKLFHARVETLLRTPREIENSLLRRPRLALVVRTVLGLVFLLGFMAIPMACTTVVTPPGHLREPVGVYLLDHGRTASLVLPADEGQLVRYAYGDWGWYALGNTGMWRGVLALFWPTQGTLGRREFHASPDPRSVVYASGIGAENVHVIRVERAKVNQLRQRLDDIHERHVHTLVISDESNLDFVHHPRSYTYFHNSNHRVAAWLRELDCRTRGSSFMSSWRIRDLPE